MKRISILLLLILLSHALFGETIIAPVKGIIVLSPQSDTENTVKIGLEDAFAIDLQDEKKLIESITVSLTLPNALKKYSDSFMIDIYGSVKPSPDRRKKNYRGTRLFSHFLPYLNRLYITIPIEGHNIPREKLIEDTKRGSFVVKGEVKRAKFPIMVTIQPVMKGLPDWIFNQSFTFSVKTRKKDIGFVQIDIEKPDNAEESSFTLTIDGNTYENYNRPIKLKTGIHNLSIQSDFFEPISSTFTIEAGKTTTVNLTLKEVFSSVSFEVPENATIYVDGEKLPTSDYRRFQLKEGEHFIRIKIGDYNLTRKIEVKRNRNYKITVIFDMLVKEY